MANSCLGLNEIVTSIAAILVSDKATASAVAFARCSRSLEEPVLCEVWRCLSSLEPLIKCFPPEVWEYKNGELLFKRAPLSIEWTRFQQRYASKVRHLQVSESSSAIEDISLAALQLLQIYSHGDPLLPNLLSLDWNIDGADPLFIITSFISRSLASINIEISASASLILPSILTRLSTLVPDISDVAVRRLKYGPSLEEASSQLLMQCNPNRLRTYNVDAPLSASAFSHVVQLPLLEHLWLVEPFHFPDPLPDVVFPSLQGLNVKFTRDLAWLKILPKCPDLTGIEITCLGPDVAQFMETLHSTITGCGMHKRLQELTFCSRDEFKITPQMIASNSSLKNLTVFELYSTNFISCQTLDLTDADISLLANAMPRLQNLVIGEEPCRVRSKITFNSLYTISRRCTGLRTLRIHFNPDSFITKFKAGFKSGNGDFEIPSSDLCSVTKINVGSITIPTHAYYTMALGLLRIFPCLEEVVHKSFDWEEISRLVGFYRDIRTAALN